MGSVKGKPDVQSGLTDVKGMTLAMAIRAGFRAVPLSSNYKSGVGAKRLKAWIIEKFPHLTEAVRGSGFGTALSIARSAYRTDSAVGRRATIAIDPHEKIMPGLSMGEAVAEALRVFPAVLRKRGDHQLLDNVRLWITTRWPSLTSRMRTPEFTWAIDAECQRIIEGTSDVRSTLFDSIPLVVGGSSPSPGASDVILASAKAAEASLRGEPLDKAGGSGPLVTEPHTTSPLRKAVRRGLHELPDARDPSPDGAGTHKLRRWVADRYPQFKPRLSTPYFNHILSVERKLLREAMAADRRERLDVAAALVESGVATAELKPDVPQEVAPEPAPPVLFVPEPAGLEAAGPGEYHGTKVLVPPEELLASGLLESAESPPPGRTPTRVPTLADLEDALTLCRSLNVSPSVLRQGLGAVDDVVVTLECLECLTKIESQGLWERSS